MDENQINMEDLDFNLVEATLASIQTKTLTPIIKQELRLKIQTNRLAAGKEELPKPVFKEPEKFELTAEEVQKKNHRRELNRLAASKCRDKKKNERRSLENEEKHQKRINEGLKARILELEDEKREVVYKLKQLGIPIPENIIAEAASNPKINDSANPPTNYIDLPSTSSGIFEDHMLRRSSAEFYRPPPPYQPPRRWSSDVPFSRYSENSSMSEQSEFNACSDLLEYKTARRFSTSSTGSYTPAQLMNLPLEEDELDFLENQTIQLESFFQPQAPDMHHNHQHDAKYLDENDVKFCMSGTDEEMTRIQQLFIPVNATEDATVPGSEDSDALCTTPTFYLE